MSSTLIEPRFVFAVLGPLLLLLGALRCLRGGESVTQGRIWMLVGVIFAAMAAWLQWGVAAAA